MSELSTATLIATPEDADILPIRKAGVSGLLKITLLKIAAYIKAELVIPDDYFVPEGTPVDGYVLTWNEDDEVAEWQTPASAPTLYARIPVFAVATPADAEVLLVYAVPEDITFPANFAGSVGKIANGGTNPASTFVATVHDDGTQIGTISVSTSGVFTFATTSGTSKSIDAGHCIIVRGPSTTDDDIVNFAATLVAEID